MKKSKKSGTSSSWSRKEDDILLYAYKKFPRNWTKIASIVGNDKTVKDCKQRIHCSATDKNNIKFISNGCQWTDELDKKLLRLHDKYGNEWQLIAKQFKGKTSK